MIISVVICFYIIFVSLWNLITPFLSMDAAVALVGQNIVGWTVLPFYLAAIIWSRFNKQTWYDRIQYVLFGMLYADILYSGGVIGLLFALELLLIAVCFYGTDWFWKRKSLRISVAALLTIEIFSLVLLIQQPGTMNMGKRFMESIWLDICFVAVIILFSCEVKLKLLIRSFREKHRGTPAVWKRGGRAVKYTAMFCAAALGAVVIYSGYKIYVGQIILVKSADAVVMGQSWEELEYVRALRSPNVQLASGAYTWDISYSCEEDQLYEILWVDGTQKPPVVLSGELPADEEQITVEMDVTGDMQGGYFGLYLSYNGNGGLEAGDTVISNDNKEIASFTAGDYTVPFLIDRVQSGVVDPYLLYKSYYFFYLPENSGNQVIATGIDLENCAYRIWDIDEDGNAILQYDSIQDSSTADIGHNITASQVVVDVYLKKDSETEIVPEINNLKYVSEIKYKSAAMMIIWAASMLARLGTMILNERKVRKSSDGEDT